MDAAQTSFWNLPAWLQCSDISSVDVSLADVIPIVTILLVTLEHHDNDTGVQTVKSVLLEDVKRRFQGMADEPLYVIATSVDPRYRMRMFDVEQQTKAAALLTAEIQQERQSVGVAGPPALTTNRKAKYA